MKIDGEILRLVHPNDAFATDATRSGKRAHTKSRQGRLNIVGRVYTRCSRSALM